MKKLFLLSFFLTTFSLLSVLTTPSFAVGPPGTWNVVPMAFYGQIHIVKFLDALGPADSIYGYVGDDTGIWYTTNTGTTWTRATITGPNGEISTFNTGWVNDITFKDPMHGFAVIDSNSNSPYSGILVTTNGGSIWKFLPAGAAPDSGRGIYYNIAKGLLFVASCNKTRGFVVSPDDGATWKVIDTNNYYTGFAMNGNGNGVLATKASICLSRTQNYWLRTTDGGQNWEPTRMAVESWQPAGIPTTQTFFAATSNFCSATGLSIMRSDDDGFSFGPEGGYNSTIDTLSQAMAGDGCELFASSYSATNGMWYSANEGANWLLMIGAPNPLTNTRFYLSPTTVWSFAFDSLKNIARPPTGDIHIWPDLIAFKNAACQTLADTNVHIFGCNCANSPTLTGATVTKLTTIVDTIQANTLPPTPPSQPLCVSGLGTADSVVVKFQPTSPLSDSADIHVHFLDNGAVLDTIVHIVANGIVPDPEIIGPKSITIRAPACSETIDTTVELFNSSCNTIILQNCTINGSAMCACQLQLTGCCDIDNNVQGITLLPGQSFTLHIDYQPGLIIGTCASSFQVNWITSDGSVSGTTKLVTVTASTTTNLKPSFRGFNINKKNCCDVPSDTTIFFVNTTCDTILLSTPVVYGPGSCPGHFRIDSTGTFPVHFPVKLPPGQHIPLTIDLDCEGTSCTAFIKFPYTIAAYFSTTSSCSSSIDCSAFASDELIDTLSLSTLAGITPPTMSPNPINFGAVNCCDTVEERTFTITAGCKADTITKLVLSNSPQSNFYLDTAGIGLPIYMAAGQKSTFKMGFHPLCGGGSGGTDTGSVWVSFGTYPQLHSNVVATSTNLATAGLSTQIVGFDSVKTCDAGSCKTVTLTNESCGPIAITVFKQPKAGCFSASAVASATIPVGGSVIDTVCLNPGTCGVGNDTDIVVYQVCDPSGGSCTLDTLTLGAYIVPPVIANTVTTIPSATICSTDMIGETFTLTNNGTCYTDNITSVSSGNPQVTVTPQTITVPVNGSQSFNVTFTPTGVGVDSGWIVLTNSDGTTDSVHYDFADTACNTVTGHFVFPPLVTDTIVTPNCTPGTLTFSASAGGGAGAITGITLTGSNQFSTPDANGGPMTFTGHINFDPNQNGNDSTQIQINYTIDGGPTLDTTFELYAKTVGVKDSARIGVLGLTATCIVPNDTMLDTFAVILRDSVSDALGVTQLSFVINYDDNLLFNPSVFDLAPGWHVGSIKDSADGVHVTLTYSGNPPQGYTGANDTLFKISELGAISKLQVSTAKIVNAHFNDSSFEACSMKALSSTGDLASICIDTTGCGGRVLRGVFNNTLVPFSDIQVVPNPARKGASAATLHFTTYVSANGTVDVLDVLGHSVATLSDGSLEVGEHAFSIPTNQMPEGAYFARITVNGVTVIQQFVLEKE